MRILLAILAFAVLALFAEWNSHYVMRSGYQFFELIGIMDPSGPLGGQISGFNYQRFPTWAHPVIRFLAAAIIYAPAILIPASIALRRHTQHTLCGACGDRLVLTPKLTCARCGVRL